MTGTLRSITSTRESHDDQEGEHPMTTIATLPEPGEASVEDRVQISLRLIEQARVELAGGDRLQATEKVWGALAQMMKAHGQQRGWLNLGSHRTVGHIARQLDAKNMARLPWLQRLCCGGQWAPEFLRQRDEPARDRRDHRRGWKRAAGVGKRAWRPAASIHHQRGKRMEGANTNGEAEPAGGRYVAGGVFEPPRGRGMRKRQCLPFVQPATRRFRMSGCRNRWPII